MGLSFLQIRIIYYSQNNFRDLQGFSDFMDDKNPQVSRWENTNVEYLHCLNTNSLNLGIGFRKISQPSCVRNHMGLFIFLTTGCSALIQVSETFMISKREVLPVENKRFRLLLKLSQHILVDAQALSPWLLTHLTYLAHDSWSSYLGPRPPITAWPPPLVFPNGGCWWPLRLLSLPLWASSTPNIWSEPKVTLSFCRIHLSNSSSQVFTALVWCQRPLTVAAIHLRPGPVLIQRHLPSLPVFLYHFLWQSLMGTRRMPHIFVR